MRVMIFDTETIGKVTQSLLNVGYRIVDINVATGEEKVLCERDYLNKDLYNNHMLMINDDFVGLAKYAQYKQLVEQQLISKHSIYHIMNSVQRDIEKYKVKSAYAYNCAFDMDKFAKTSAELGIDNPLNSVSVFDIWGYATKYIMDNDFIEWAKDNKIFTASGSYISSTVETIIRYLSQNMEFNEDHTALSDSRWETEILKECIRRGCDITVPQQVKKLKSDKVFDELFKLPNGDIIKIQYKNKYVKNNMTTYKM